MSLRFLLLLAADLLTTSYERRGGRAGVDSVQSALGPDGALLFPTTGGVLHFQERHGFVAKGQIKFIFPNEQNVYLCDTPTRTHFSLSEQSFSSECIRLVRPLDLAEYLLKDTPGWSRSRIEQSAGRDREVTLPLNRCMPVHLLYRTACRPEGAVHVRTDVYERDSRVDSALAAPLLTLHKHRR